MENYGFKKKNKYKKQAQTNNYSENDKFREVCFRVGKEGPKLYSKTIERLGLYASAQFKNGPDVKKCLMSGKVAKPLVPDLADNHTAYEKGCGIIG